MSFADEAIDKAIDARRAYFTLFGANIGPLGAMAKGNIEYNADTATMHAKNFAALASYSPVAHFPAGSSNADKKGKTRALPLIWSDFDGFVGKLGNFQKAVDGLQAKAGAGRAELGSALGDLGASCKGCHEKYRAKDF